MKLTKAKLKAIIKEELSAVMKEEQGMHQIAKGLVVRKSRTEELPSSPQDFEYGDEDEGPSKVDYYEIVDQSGKVVGGFNVDDYMGNIYGGRLYGRHLPNLDSYQGAAMGRSGPLGKLHAFFKSNTGRKWLDITMRRGEHL